jgi:hypothetical protein
MTVTRDVVKNDLRGRRGIFARFEDVSVKAFNPGF